MDCSQTVGIAGFGRFGRALGELLTVAGMDFRAYDPVVPVESEHAVASLAELAAVARTLVVAAPVRGLAGVLTAMKGSLGPDHLVMDVCSVKTIPETCLREQLGSDVPWVATHPLFGPVSLARGERPLRVVVCPNPTHPEAVERARSFYEHLGCEVALRDAESHDRLMANTHAMAFFIAKALTDMDEPIDMELAPPSFRAMQGTIDAVRADAGHLFVAIQRENPFAESARRKLVDTLQNIEEQLHQSRQEGSDVRAELAIPDLGHAVPRLAEVRDHINDLDREIVELLARRARLSRRAGQVKAEAGQGVRDPTREAALLDVRAAWGDQKGLSGSAVRDIFEAILRQSRALQRK